MTRRKMNPKIVRVNATEFEMDDGTIIPHAIELDEDQLPTVEEFQKIYDRWKEVITKELEDGQTS